MLRASRVWQFGLPSALGNHEQRDPEREAYAAKESCLEGKNPEEKSIERAEGNVKIRATSPLDAWQQPPITKQP